MKPSLLRPLLLILLLVILVSAFFLLNFRLLWSQMDVDTNIITHAFGVKEGRSLRPAQDLVLYLKAPRGLEAALAVHLRETLVSNPHVGAVDVRTVPPAPADESVLVVAIGEPSVIVWTPVYVRSVATLDVAYASDGDVAWIDEEVVVVTNSSESAPVVRVRAEHVFDGHGYGLVSAPGYADYLAGQFAMQVNQVLENALLEQEGQR